jgi:phage terminase large subunit-like protein
MRDENPKAFSSQYQNNPVADDVAIVKADWIKRSHPPARFESIAIGVDLASSRKNSADYSAFVVVGKVEGKFYDNRSTILSLLEIPKMRKLC